MELFLASAALVVSVIGPIGVALFWLGRLKGTVCGLRDDFEVIRDNHSHQIEELVKAQMETGKQVAALQERTGHILTQMQRLNSNTERRRSQGRGGE